LQNYGVINFVQFFLDHPVLSVAVYTAFIQHWPSADICAIVHLIIKSFN